LETTSEVFQGFLTDTEGSFIVKRVVDIADAAVKHMQHVVESSDMDEAERSLQTEALKKSSSG